MSDTLYVESNGLAFNEKKDMDMLREYAEKGWLFEKLQFTGYQLKKGEPQNLIYSLSIENRPNKEYFRMFEESGWTHVYSKDNLHFFNAPKGTTPLYTDKESLVEKYKMAKDKKLRSSKPIIYVLLLTLLISVFTYIGWLPTFFGRVSLFVGYVSLILLIFILYPYFSYRKKYKDSIEKNFDM